LSTFPGEYRAARRFSRTPCARNAKHHRGFEILDNPKAINQQPAAARVLAALLEKLRSASARGRRGNLVSVRAMTEERGA
jgi:hypothetical protein